jgi:hypothetical protein
MPGAEMRNRCSRGLVLGVQRVGCFLKSIVSRGFPVGFYVVLLLANGSEEQSVASNVDMGLGNLPMSLAHQPAFDVEGSPLIELGEEAKSNQDAVAELAAEGSNAVAVASDDHLSAHGAHDASLHVGWVKIALRSEAERDEFGSFAYGRPDEGVGEHPEHLGGLGIVVGAVLSGPGLCIGIMHIVVDTSGFGLGPAGG